MSNFNRTGLLVARVLLVLVFLLAGLNKLMNYGATAEDIAAHGVPLAAIATPLAILFELGGAILVVIGYRTREAALALILFTVLATLFYHRFWEMSGQEQMINMIMFLKNLGLIGGLMMLWHLGPGELSLDAKKSAASA